MTAENLLVEGRPRFMCSLKYPEISPQRVLFEHVAKVCVSYVHDDVMTWKRFPHHRAICEGNPPITPRSPVDSPHKGSVPVIPFLEVSLNKLLNKESSCRWSETSWRHDDCVIFLVGWQSAGVINHSRADPNFMWDMNLVITGRHMM